jgi:hypothetical protein
MKTILLEKEYPIRKIVHRNLHTKAMGDLRHSILDQMEIHPEI